MRNYGADYTANPIKTRVLNERRMKPSDSKCKLKSADHPVERQTIYDLTITVASSSFDEAD